jgi:hypothetical protein
MLHTEPQSPTDYEDRTPRNLPSRFFSRPTAAPPVTNRLPEPETAEDGGAGTTQPAQNTRRVYACCDIATGKSTAVDFPVAIFQAG